MNLMTFTKRRPMRVALLTFLLVLAALATPLTFAQNNPITAAQARERLFKELGLTAPQRKKMDAIDNKYRPRAQKLATQIQSLQKQLYTVMQQADKESMAVLSKAQTAKLQKLQKAEIARMKQQMQQQQNGGKK